MIEASMIVQGEGVAELPTLLHAGLAARSSLDDPRILIIEHSAGWFGCSPITVVVCNAIDEREVRLTILRSEGLRLPILWTVRRRLRQLTYVMKQITEICEARGWTRTDLGFLF